MAVPRVIHLRVDSVRRRTLVGVVLGWLIIASLGAILGAIPPESISSFPPPAALFLPDMAPEGLLRSGQMWEGQLPPKDDEISSRGGDYVLNPLNRFVALAIQPYPAGGENGTMGAPFQSTLTVESHLWGGKVTGSGSSKSVSWTPIGEAQKTTQLVDCTADVSYPCTAFLLIIEPFVSYHAYKFQAWMPDASERVSFGEAEFVVIWGNYDFTLMQLFTSLTFGLWTVVTLLVFIVRLKRTSLSALSTMPWEQKCCLLLLIALFFYNDPMYALQFSVRGWFFPWVHASLQVIFNATLLLFWIMTAEHFARCAYGNEETPPQFQGLILEQRHWPKTAILSGYVIINVLMLGWSEALELDDPIVGQNSSSLAFTVMFLIVATLYSALALWVVVLMAWALPRIVRRTIPSPRSESSTPANRANSSGDDANSDHEQSTSAGSSHSSFHSLDTIAVGETRALQSHRADSTIEPPTVVRFLFFSITTFVVVLSVLVGILLGTFGTIQETTSSFLYFSLLFNGYVVLLVWAWWPMQSARPLARLGEDTPLTSF